MFKVILTGTNPIIWTDVLRNWNAGLVAFISQKTLFKTRPIVGLIHALVAWGFTLYLAVNIIDVLYGFIPNFKFLPNNIVGDVYRLFVDIFSVLVLLGVLYFLARRFIIKEDRLTIKDPVMLSDKAKKGMKFDSFLVGAFIIVSAHLSFKRAWDGLKKERKINVDFLDGLAVLLHSLEGFQTKQGSTANEYRMIC